MIAGVTPPGGVAPGFLSERSAARQAKQGKAASDRTGQNKTDRIEYELEQSNKKRREHILPQQPQTLVDHKFFHFFVGFLIFFNTIQLGVESDYPDLPIWLFVESFVTGGFVLELILNVYYKGTGYFHDSWNLMDVSLVGVSVADLIVATAMANFSFLRQLSVLRILRMVRIVRILRFVKGLKKVVLVCEGVVEAFKSTFWVTMVLFIAIYTGSIFCVGMLGQDRGKDIYPGYSDETKSGIEAVDSFNPRLMFGTVPRSMLTLFNVAIAGEWETVIRPVYEYQPGLAVFFVLFVMFVSFGIMNVIIGMIVDAVITNATNMMQEEADQVRKKKLSVLNEVRGLVRKIDVDNTGQIDYEELEAAMSGDSSELLELLNHSDLSLPIGFSAQESIDLLDADGSGSLGHDEFVQSLYRLIDSSHVPFQQVCLMQMGINSLKTLLVRQKKDTDDRLRRIEHLLAYGTAPPPTNGPLDGSASRRCLNSPPPPRSASCKMACMYAQTYEGAEEWPRTAEEWPPRPPANVHPDAYDSRLPGAHSYLQRPVTTPRELDGWASPQDPCSARRARPDGAWRRMALRPAFSAPPCPADRGLDYGDRRRATPRPAAAPPPRALLGRYPCNASPRAGFRVPGQDGPVKTPRLASDGMHSHV